jgi:antitoxin component of RelBE/YafQ-DinJ toxin-antitoxin module
MSETTLHFQVGDKVEQQALAAIGLTLDDVVRDFLEQVANNQAPFQIGVFSATTRAAMQRTRERVRERAMARANSEAGDDSAGD